MALFKLKVILILFSFVSFGQNRVSEYRVNSVASIAGCYSIEPFKFQERQIGASEILNLCTQKVVSWAGTIAKSESQLLKVAEEIQRGHRVESALPVYKLAASNSTNQKVCENSGLYSAIVAGLSHPIGYPSYEQSDVKAAYEVIGVCVKNKQFYSDIIEELDKDEKYLKGNLCEYFKLENKKMSQCK